MVNYGYLVGGAVSSPMESIQTALTTAFTSISSDFATTIGNVLPVALGITGMIMVISFGIRLFRKLAK